MQISDLIGQYNNSLNAGSRIAGGTKGVSQVADTMNKLSAGQLFEGTVTGMKGSEVRLSLSNGQAINARLAGDVNLIEGESVFFEVKSNDGGTVNIRPVSMGTMNNPTLLTALDAAGLPVTEDSLSMVNAMMSEQLPIDSKALSNMAKMHNMYPNADISTLVTMTKLGMD
ncbi:MAG: flagellar hook-length control protein FliK, partial [Lachnospiraceae bacterium]|nr:flagellar hook-length control protein FliK [Lachnospiraceae bacterium]